MKQLVLAPFREILNTRVYETLLGYGLANPPMSVLGYFLRIVGNHFLRFARQHKKNTPIIKINHEVNNSLI
jgi:hypothetical protein